MSHRVLVTISTAILSFLAAAFVSFLIDDKNWLSYAFTYANAATIGCLVGYSACKNVTK